MEELVLNSNNGRNQSNFFNLDRVKQMKWIFQVIRQLNSQLWEACSMIETLSLISKVTKGTKDIRTLGFEGEDTP